MADLTTEITTAKGMENTQSESVETPESKVRRVLEAWKDGRGNALMTLLTDDVRWTIAGRSVAAGTTIGKKELNEKVSQPFGVHFSNSAETFRPTEIHRLVAQNDLVVVFFDGRGMTNKGLVYKNTYAWFLTFENGLVKDVTAFFDSIAFNELWAE